MAAVPFSWVVLMSAALVTLPSAAAARHSRHHAERHHAERHHAERHHSHRHHPERHYAYHGIDVSHHQGHIAWTKLPRQGVDFAYIKATEGADHVDGRFSVNWHAADAAGVRRGAYHFFTLCRSGRDQAVHFIHQVPSEAAALPPAVDLEFPGNCKYRPSRAKFDKELGDFLDIVESHYGKRAVLYLTPHFDKRYRVSANFGRRLWLRSLSSEPRFGARRWTIWQSSSSRKLDGVRGHVDWNIARSAV